MRRSLAPLIFASGTGKFLEQASRNTLSSQGYRCMCKLSTKCGVALGGEEVADRFRIMVKIIVDNPPSIVLFGALLVLVMSSLLQVLDHEELARRLLGFFWPMLGSGVLLQLGYLALKSYKRNK